MKTLYVGNLPFDATEAQVRALFSPLGEVGEIKLINDRDTGQPRGFAFVEMEDQSAEALLANPPALVLGDRALRISLARPRGVRRLRRPRRVS